MSSKYPILPSSEIVKILRQFGFEKVSQKGSHAKYKNYYSNRICIVPMHDEIAKGTLKSILEQANIKIEDFLKKL
ncbi:MAG: type II toxin-antitoxin system HicA family toxin [Clostridia bacterium]